MSQEKEIFLFNNQYTKFMLDRPEIINISVIIVAYNRKMYVKQAVESVLNQTYDKNKYEIIVVKNFHDEDIDKFLIANKVNNIFSLNDEYGKQLSIGISNSNGDIICFLDDDDLFDENKLKRVYQIFNAYEIMYYRNSYKNIDENRNEVHNNELLNFEKPLYYKNSFNTPLNIISRIVNMSGTCIKKSFISKYLDPLSKLYITPDRFINELPYIEDIGSFYDSEKLSLYRVHESSSHTKIKDKNAFINKQLLVTERAIKDHKFLLEFEKNTKMELLMKYYLLILLNHLYLIKKGAKRPKFKEYLYLLRYANKFELRFDYIEIIMGLLGFFGYKFRFWCIYNFNNLLNKRSHIH